MVNINFFDVSFKEAKNKTRRLEYPFQNYGKKIRPFRLVPLTKNQAI